jgi:hypothetical protein
MRIRPLLVALHRDVGFFAVGLTLVYGVSGIAVNHREHWDYNYSRELRVERIGLPAELLGKADAAAQPGELARAEQDVLVKRIVQASGRTDPPYNAFWRGPDRLSLFFGSGDQDVVDYSPSTGVIQHVRRAKRPLLRQLNFLHLNEGHGLWTWFADGYAVLLLFLAISGPFIIKGRKGLAGRGGLYLALGVGVPIALYFLLAP